MSGLVIAAATSRANVSPPTAVRSGQQLRALAEWVNGTGAATVIRGHVAQGLGLPDIDLSVQQRGLRIAGERLTHVCAVPRVKGPVEMLILARVDERDGIADVWLASVTGDLLAAVRFEAGAVEVQSKNDAEANFDTEKDWMLSKLQAEQGRDYEPTPIPREAKPSAVATPAASAPEVRYGTAPIRHRRFFWETTTLTSLPWIVPAVIIVLIIGAIGPTRRR
ncbi:MAG: hypothetical protein M3Z64_08925 [Verrucomicrobiota bacterium]|nr:hypothetical protein [Verrucomicrobiota bacterium]